MNTENKKISIITSKERQKNTQKKSNRKNEGCKGDEKKGVKFEESQILQANKKKDAN